MSALICTLVTPERLVFSEEAEMVIVPGAEGDFGVMAHHVPLISIIRPGVVELHKAGGAVQKIFVSAGYAETHGTECTILAETAEPLATLRRETAEAELQAARTALGQATDDLSRARAEKALEIAEAKIRAAA